MVNMKSPFIIGDVGSNHRGHLELALKHLEVGKACGLDAVKFQLYSSEELYGQPNDNVDSWSVRREWLPALKECADKLGVEFMCSSFSREGYQYVDPFVNIHKIASSEALCPLIAETVRNFGKPIIISTGALSANEVHWLIDQNTGHDLTLLECVTNYPADIAHYNLAAMANWGRLAKVGISDHTLDEVLACAAVGAGATMFEKHFDAAPSLGTTPDSGVSVSDYNMVDYVNAIRLAFSALNSGHKTPAHQHASMLRYRRRPIATINLKAGDVLELGKNYGNFRSLVDDTRGAPAQSVREFDQRVLNTDILAGQALWFTDLV